MKNGIGLQPALRGRLRGGGGVPKPDPEVVSLLYSALIGVSMFCINCVLSYILF